MFLAQYLTCWAKQGGLSRAVGSRDGQHPGARSRPSRLRFRLFRKPLFLTCSILPLLSLKYKKPLSEIQREDIISIPRLHQQAHMRGSCQLCLHTAHNGKPRKTAPAQPGQFRSLFISGLLRIRERFYLVTIIIFQPEGKSKG